MAIDAYVKFGDGDDDLPEIEGDSDDAEHYWWCELRDCGFELENPEDDPDSSEGTKNTKDPTSYFKAVRLKKRVDWASTQLFIKCCEAAEASTKKTDAEEGDDKKGVIDVVTVHVCRPSAKEGERQGERKIPYVVVRYRDVRVTHYKIDISDPEPAEELTLEFDSLEYEFQPTDPYTGLAKGPAEKTFTMDNHGNRQKQTGAAQTAAAAAPAAGAAPAGSGSSGAGGGAAAAPSPVPASNGSASIATATDLAVLTNFPGAGSLNNSGVLPA